MIFKRSFFTTTRRNIAFSPIVVAIYPTIAPRPIYVKGAIMASAVSEVPRSVVGRRRADFNREGGSVPAGVWATAGSGGESLQKNSRVVQDQRSAARRPRGAGFNWYPADYRSPGSTRDSHGVRWRSECHGCRGAGNATGKGVPSPRPVRSAAIR